MDSDQGKLFIGGISWETSEEKLKDYFSAYGDVLETVIMKDRTTGRARGFGFVAFADPSVADRVLLEKHTIDGRVVEAKKAVPREEQHNFARSNNAGPVSGGLTRTKKIFVGGLPSTLSEEEFKNYFAQFGDITDVVVMYDHNTQRPRGFGFITFDSEDSVEKVVQKSYHELHDKMVEVKKAIPKELSASPGNRTNAGSFGPGSGVGRGAPYNSGYSQGYNSSPNNAYGANRYAPPPAGRGGFPSYTPTGYGTPGYGTGSGYGVAINGGYGGSGYGSGAGYPAAGGYGGYGNAPAATGYGGGVGYASTGAPSAGYVNAPAGPRSPWGNAGTGFTAGGSPAAYGAGGAGGNYGTAGWTSGGAGAQATSGAATYGSGGYGYGTGDTGYGSNTGGYPARGTAGGPTGYGDTYASTGAYGDSTWRSGEAHSTPATASAAGTGGGYGMAAGGGMDGVAGGMGAGSATDATGYGVAGRQTQRGPDTRFRPYPATGERTA